MTLAINVVAGHPIPPGVSMSPVEIIVTLIGGGVLGKLIEKVFDLAINRGRTVRDELRQEITRLEGHITGLETKVDNLESEIDQWKNTVDEWRGKFYALLEEHQLLKVAQATKDALILTLQSELARWKPKEEEING